MTVNIVFTHGGDLTATIDVLIHLGTISNGD